jgi:hypothetical protein
MVDVVVVGNIDRYSLVFNRVAVLVVVVGWCLVFIRVVVFVGVASNIDCYCLVFTKVVVLVVVVGVIWFSPE